MEDKTMVNEAAETEDEEELQEEVVEESEDDSEALEAAIAEDSNQSEEEQAPSQGTRQEPGYVKSRIEKAVARAVAETEARMQANFDRQLAPYREQMINMEAQDLVRSGKVKDLETAKELVRYRQNAPQATPEATPQNEPPDERDPETSARIDLLSHQADRIKEKTGLDVISVFMNDEDVKARIVSGEWDFYDVAEAMQKPKKKAPSPMRSPNGASGFQPNAIDSMTDEQFEQMEKNIKTKGARYRLR